MRAQFCTSPLLPEFESYAVYLDASVVVNKVLEADDVNFGYDAMEGEYVNMIEQGIIDPTKVITNQC